MLMEETEAVKLLARVCQCEGLLHCPLGQATWVAFHFQADLLKIPLWL